MNRNIFFKFLTILNLVLLISGGVYFFSAGSQMIVYVDSNKLLNGYEGMLKAKDEYQKKAVTWKANIDTLTNEVRRQIMDYEKSSSKMSAREKHLSQELIRTKQNQLAQYQQAMNAQAQQEDAQMTGNVLTQINSYIKKYGKKKGYTIILAATEYGNMAYADEGLDITDEILQGLNDEYKGQ